MKNKFRIFSAAIFTLLSLFIFQTANAQIAGPQGLLSGLPAACLDKGDCSFCDIITVANNVISVILGITGSLALIAFVMAGFWLIVSQGDATKTKKAFSIFRAATIGIALVFFSYTIVNFVLNVLISTGKGDLKFTDYFKNSTWSDVCSGKAGSTLTAPSSTTPTPTPVPAAPAAVCGNHKCEGSENPKICPADCTTKVCTPPANIDPSTLNCACPAGSDLI